MDSHPGYVAGPASAPLLVFSWVPSWCRGGRGKTPTPLGEIPGLHRDCATVGIPVPVPGEPSPSFLESPLPLLFLLQVQMVKMSELKEHLPRECLPEYLGGSLKLDPLSWNCRFLPQQNGHPDPLDELILVPLVAPKDNGSVHVPGPKSVTLQELLDHVSHKQKRGIYEEYEDIRRRSPAGTFVCSL